MSTITEDIVLREVEHILGSGNGTLDFAVAGENDYYTWRGCEEADWTITDTGRIENVEEDRIVIFPEGEYFVCEIKADTEESNNGPVRCFCE